MKAQEDIKAQMKAYKITQKQICEVSGVSRSIVSQWLNGKGNITYENLKKIADAVDAEVRIIRK